MSKIDYSQMSDLEVKQYFLSHRDDRTAFAAYMERRNTSVHQKIISKNELEILSEEEQMKLIEERLLERLKHQ
jgi:hypothetical protein